MASKHSEFKSYVDFTGIMNMAHRGGAGYGPENTLQAFHQALTEGAQVFELDIQYTQDGHIIVHHDPDLERTAGVSLKISDTPLKDLKTFDIAQAFRRNNNKPPPLIARALEQNIILPTLEEVFDAFPHARINIDIKPKRRFPVLELIRLIEEKGMTDRVLVVSQYRKYLKLIRRINPRLATGLSMSEVFCLKFLPFYRPKGDALQIGRLYYLRGLITIGKVTKRLIAKAHKKGLKVHVFITEGKEGMMPKEGMEKEAEDMKRLLDLGVDGIITDYPSILKQIFDS
jgi:glycerophosphoryl diester phosphodiesterase